MNSKVDYMVMVRQNVVHYPLYQMGTQALSYYYIHYTLIILTSQAGTGIN